MPRIPALYCHIPFCRNICPFCAFAVHGNREGLHRPYLEALKKEIACAAQRYQGRDQRIETLYIGGGTPSTLSLSAVGELLDWLERHFPFAPHIEIAFELNPEDVQSSYLRELCRAGINRLSLGLQSLQGATLQILGRHAEHGRKALEILQTESAENHNVDLMLGIPDAPPEAFLSDLEELAALRPPHISLYVLEVEPHTPFGRNPRIRHWWERSSTASAQNYLRASTLLTARGYIHYEVSNFCLPGKEGRQNLAVWNGENYLGFGCGAHSRLEAQRWRNPRGLNAYLRAREGEHSPKGPQQGLEVLAPRQRSDEALMLALRQQSGLDIRDWERRWKQHWGKRREAICAQLAREGQAHWNQGRLQLTPQGFLLADEVTATLMVD